MTRKDWWLGVLLVLAALLVQTFVLIQANRAAIETALALRPMPTDAMLR
jgi:hypothetical protein